MMFVETSSAASEGRVRLDETMLAVVFIRLHLSESLEPCTSGTTKSALSSRLI